MYLAAGGANEMYLAVAGASEMYLAAAASCAMYLTAAGASEMYLAAMRASEMYLAAMGASEMYPAPKTLALISTLMAQRYFKLTTFGRQKLRNPVLSHRESKGCQFRGRGSRFARAARD